MVDCRATGPGCGRDRNRPEAKWNENNESGSKTDWKQNRPERTDPGTEYTGEKQGRRINCSCFFRHLTRS